jgi:hypothetical protein
MNNDYRTPNIQCRNKIATATFGGLAMTQKPIVCHCEERSDEAISTFSTAPEPPFFMGNNGATGSSARQIVAKIRQRFLCR